MFRYLAPCGAMAWLLIFSPLAEAQSFPKNEPSTTLDNNSITEMLSEESLEFALEDPPEIEEGDTESVLHDPGEISNGSADIEPPRQPELETQHRVAIGALSRGAPINALDENGSTFLAEAAANGNLPLVMELLRRGAKVDTPDYEGATPLMLALFNGQIEIVNELLKRNASLHLKTPDGDTTLMFAVDSLSKDETAKVLVDYLIKNGVDVGARNNLGETAIMRAATRGSLNIYLEWALWFYRE